MTAFDDLRGAVVEKVRGDLIPLIRDNPKFLGREKLIARFEDQVARRRTNEDFAQILETINEIAAAVSILTLHGYACRTQREVGHASERQSCYRHRWCSRHGRI